MLSEPAGLRVAADLLDGLAGKSELFGGAAVYKPVRIVCNTDERYHRVHDRRLNAELVSDGCPADEGDGNVLGEIAVVYIVRASNGGQPMAYMGSQESMVSTPAKSSSAWIL